MSAGSGVPPLTGGQDAGALNLVPYPQHVSFRGSPFRPAPGMYLHLPSSPPQGLRLKAKIIASQLTEAGVRTHLESSPALNGFQALFSASPNVPKAWMERQRYGMNRPIQREGYVLMVSGEGIMLQAQDDHGFYYGGQTICQLLEDGRPVPGMEIEDSPLLPYRGVHWDLRGWPPTRSYFERVINQVSSLKCNMLLVDYAEQFQFNSQPGMASEDAFPPKFMAEMDLYARERGVQLIPQLPCIGNVEHLLRLEPYRELREDVRYYQQFCPSHPSTLEIYFAMVEDLIGVHQSPFFHIGGDGARFLGTCPACHTRAREMGGRSSLYLDHLGKVCQYLIQRGKAVLIWIDHIREMTDEQIKWLPPEVVFMFRDYDVQGEAGAQALRVDLERMRSLGRQVWGAGSRSLSRGRQVYEGLDGWGASAGEGLIGGLFVATWTRQYPTGPLREPPEATWPAVYFGAERAWTGIESDNEDDILKRIMGRLFGFQDGEQARRSWNIFDLMGQGYAREARTFIRDAHNHSKRNKRLLVFLDAWCRAETFYSYLCRFEDEIAADHANLQAGSADPFRAGRLRWRVEDLKNCVPELVRAFRECGASLTSPSAVEEFLNGKVNYGMGRLDEMAQVLSTYPLPDEHWQQPVQV